MANQAAQSHQNNQPKPSNQAMIWSIYRTLVGIGMVCAMLIVGVFLGTAPVIEENRVRALRQAIFDVLPGAQSTQTYVYSEANGGTLARVNEGNSSYSQYLVYAGFDQHGHLVGVALQAHGQGYQDVVSILYGYDPQQQAIIGMQVLESRETPGLGDKIETDPAFTQNFERLDVALNIHESDLKNSIEAVKSGQKNAPWQVDGITGATISSVAIAQMLDTSARLWAPRIRAQKSKLTQIKAKSDE